MPSSPSNHSRSDPRPPPLDYRRIVIPVSVWQEIQHAATSWADGTRRLTAWRKAEAQRRAAVEEVA